MYYPDKIKPFLLHPVESLRNFAGDYFYNRRYQPPDLVEQVLKAVDLHGGKACTHLLSTARYYEWREDQLLRVVEGLEATRGEDGSALGNLLKKQYEFLLLCASPSAFLLEHRERLLRCPFTEHHRTILERFFALREISARSLFEELMRCAADPRIVVGFRNMPYDYGRFLGRQLGRIAQGAFLAELGAICADPNHWDRWPAILLHEAIRQNLHVDLMGIVRHLGHTGSPAGDAIIYTVKEIGDPALAERLIAEAERRGGERLMQTLEAIPSIKHEAVRRFCLRRLEKSRDGAERALLCVCLSSLVDEASFGILERVEARGDYEPGWADLGVSLLIVKVILNDDRTGRSKESRLLVDHDQRHREETKERLGFMESFLESSP
ncbi:MAG: hypothetical protein HY721_33340 [Planctomycetes bacterium]|nr:hypothetical protein [Planctomycetota bacterium]